MSEQYNSEFAAPVHTVVGRTMEGTKRLTHVVLGGELVTFEMETLPLKTTEISEDGQSE